ncbi:hypothetical protein GCM10027445_37350 [Amycolatopsis endophytica]|uniref:DUF6545 domain-containing protein n=1 Tax=Amycolatopsis endophytica TaxID=860233 RepID=A0A853B7L8_9PSEU|nr:MAB_1171c family putative transporter [Amycolatopsis endophytica]NYI90990.1 hypothetical protein [Amycolatopsis endophytica]
MTGDVLHTIGTAVLVPGVVALWGALLVRAAAAVRGSAPRRRMFLAVAGLAASITIYVEPVRSLVHHALHLGTRCGVVMNVWGVLSSALILDFVLAATSRRRPVLVYSAAATVGVALLALNTGTCVTSADGSRFALFWCLLCLTHVLGTGPSALLCARYARRATNLPLRAGLSVLVTGFVSSTVFWALVVPGFLITRAPWLPSAFPLNIGVTAWVMALGIALPQLLRLHHAAGDRRTLRRLEPLWRRLTTAVPQVRLPEHGRWTSDLRLYRRVIEIRDAVVVLRDYAGPDIVEAAHVHARDDAVATACWLPFAEAAQARGAAPHPAPAPSDEPDDWAGEVGFALRLAEHQNSSAVRHFTGGSARSG